MGPSLGSDQGKTSKRGATVATVIVLLSQFITSLHTSDSLQVQMSRFREELAQSILERERFFVRKSDVADVMTKLDKMNSQLIKLNNQVNSLKTFVQDYAWTGTPEIVGCSLDVLELGEGRHHAI